MEFGEPRKMVPNPQNTPKASPISSIPPTKSPSLLLAFPCCFPAFAAPVDVLHSPRYRERWAASTAVLPLLPVEHPPSVDVSELFLICSMCSCRASLNSIRRDSTSAESVAAIAFNHKWLSRSSEGEITLTFRLPLHPHGLLSTFDQKKTHGVSFCSRENDLWNGKVD